MSAIVGVACPCGSGARYAQCCGPLHDGAMASCAEALMRSRYSAYVLALEPYLLATWHADQRPHSLDFSRSVGPVLAPRSCHPSGLWQIGYRVRLR